MKNKIENSKGKNLKGGISGINCQKEKPLSRSKVFCMISNDNVTLGGSMKNVIKSLSTFVLMISFVACGSINKLDEETEALIAGSESAVEAPSTTSEETEDSVFLDPAEIDEMSDEEILEAILLHAYSIYDSLSKKDLTGVSEFCAERIQTVLAKLEEKINQLETDEEFQAEVIEKVRSGENKPFEGGYEGKRSKRRGQRGFLESDCSGRRRGYTEDMIDEEEVQDQVNDGDFEIASEIDEESCSCGRSMRQTTSEEGLSMAEYMCDRLLSVIEDAKTDHDEDFLAQIQDKYDSECVAD